MKEREFLIYSFLLGVFVTFLYDFFRILRRVIVHKGVWISLEDLLFWSYTCMSVFLLMHRQGEGTLRWFAVMGAMTGMVVYKKTLSPLYIHFGTWLFRWLLWPARKIAKVIRVIMGRMGNCVKVTARRVGSNVHKGRKHIIFRLKKKLTFFVRLLKMTLG